MMLEPFSAALDRVTKLIQEFEEKELHTIMVGWTYLEFKVARYGNKNRILYINADRPVLDCDINTRIQFINEFPEFVKQYREWSLSRQVALISVFEKQHERIMEVLGNGYSA